MFNTPILFLIFNRPDTTQIVFDEIKKIKPKYLFVAADGARENKIGEKEKCDETRNIIKQVDWDCEIKTLFREKNLGCKIAVSSAISWFFENVEQGIILEDDCIPDQSFFYFCEELLNYYKNDQKIMHIGGNNFQFGKNKTKYSYYFSIYNHIWGWATWRRAWQKYDVTVKSFPEFTESERIKKIFKTKQMQTFWLNNFKQVYENKIDTWDYQWQYCICNNDGFAITPKTNLVTNIGFDERATHTKDRNHVSNLPKNRIETPLAHPKNINRFSKADNFTFYKIFEKKITLQQNLKKLLDVIKKYIKILLRRE
ncbi:MAG TPA: nucleotide-diphospho-sugar transferase [Spirochaetota bacterium]|nr:nucleotide-diphospho-sugar transferase [Spirochaetota bacterium]